MFLKYRNAQFPQFIVITLCALSGTHTAHAASATWNGASSSSWSASPNWSASPGPGTGNMATFDNSTAGESQTIITESITIASILFNTGSAAAYTLGGASAGMGQITLNDGGSIAVSSSITRSQTVNANLVLGTDARTASYSLSNNSTSAGQLLTFAGTIDSGKKHRESSPKILILGGIGDGRISGVISGNGSGSENSETAQVAVTKNGHGTWTFSGVNTYTGLTDTQAGTLAYGVSNALASGAVQVSGGILDLKTFSDTVGAVILSSGNITGTTGVLTGKSNGVRGGSITANLAGGGALTKSTVGTVILVGSNTYSGGTQLDAGVLALCSAGALGSAGSIGFGGGTLQFSSDNITDYSNRFTMAAGQAYSLDTNGRNVTFSTGLISSGGDLTKVGPGTLTINGISTYSGKTIVGGGALAIGASGSIANSAEVSLDGGNLNVAAKANASLGSGQSLTGSGSVTGDLTIQGTLAIGSLLGTITFEHNLALQSGSIANFDFSSGGFGIGTYDLAKGGLSKMVSFGGALNLHFKPGEVFSNDTNVKIFDFGHYEGAFSAVNVSGLSGGHSAIVDSGTGIVTVVPEPKAALLAGLGVLPLFTRRRWLAANARV